MEFVFERERDKPTKISKERILAELEKVAKQFNYTEFSRSDFSKYADINHNTAIRQFGTWGKTIIALREHLQEKNIELKPRKEPYNRVYTDKQIFDEMERIWLFLGHRPYRSEWEALDPRISYNGIVRRFGGWSKACLKFIEYKTGKYAVAETPIKAEKPISRPKLNLKPEDTRVISLGLRFEVLKRDNFKCVSCGRSPATDAGVQLHIDHIVPFAKGGKTILTNLQTLCSGCNLGKSNKD